MAGGAKLSSKTCFRIVVAGEPGTGKSSLISTAVTRPIPSNAPTVLPNVPPVLPPTQLPEDMFYFNVPVTVIDTSSRLEDRDKLADELKRADAIVLTYARDPTLDGLTTFWLPYLQRLEVKAPVTMAGCKSDLREPVFLIRMMRPIKRQFPQFENFFQCSTSEPEMIIEVFRFAQRAILYPSASIFDRKTQTFKSRCRRALIRIFILSDQDGDGALSDAEFIDLMVKCSYPPWAPELMLFSIKRLEEIFPGEVNENRLTLKGFTSFLARKIELGYPVMTWNILRAFNYNNDIRLCYDQLLRPIKRTPDQSVELTSEALEFLKRVFSLFDIDGDGAYNADELEYIFFAAPYGPWSEASFAEIKASGELSLNGFLSKWALMTLLNPVLTVENLIDIGYAGDPSSAVKVTRRRVDRKKQQFDKSVFHCFVFGPKKAGKSSLMRAFVGRLFSHVYTPTINEEYTVNIVDGLGETRKTLILVEIPQDVIEKLLIHEDALAACDVAVFVYDSSNESSWTKAKNLLVQVASHTESTGYEVPCLIVAAKDDLEPDRTARQDSARVSQDMGIEAPIPISTRLGDVNDAYRRIVRAAEYPYLSMPETEARKTRKQYYRLLNCFLVSVGVAVVIVWLVYAILKN